MELLSSYMRPRADLPTRAKVAQMTQLHKLLFKHTERHALTPPTSFSLLGDQGLLFSSNSKAIMRIYNKRGQICNHNGFLVASCMYAMASSSENWPPSTRPLTKVFIYALHGATMGCFPDLKLSISEFMHLH